MNKTLCSHLRIIDKNDYELNVPEFIQLLEEHFKIDFRSLPDWERLLLRLHAVVTDRDSIIREAQARKEKIIEKLLAEFTRSTPFELTDTLARTSRKWRKIATQIKKRSRPSKSESNSRQPTLGTEQSVIAENEIETPHQNTEENVTTTVSRQYLNDLANDDLPALPKFVITNEHNLLSPIGSNETYIGSYVPQTLDHIGTLVSEWKKIEPTKIIACAPKEIILKYDHLDEQVIKFSLTNLFNKCVHIRYHTITHNTPYFKYTKIVPVAPPKLCPGIPMTIKFIFKLVERKQEFTSEMYFKVGRNVYDEFTPTEILCIPVITKFIKSRDVQIPDAVYIPPLYPWHMKHTYPLYPKALVTIEVKDDRVYHLHIEMVKNKDSVTSFNERQIDSFLSEVEEQTLAENEASEKKHRKDKGKKGKVEIAKDAEQDPAKSKSTLSVKKGRSSVLVKPSGRGKSSAIQKDILSMLEKIKNKKEYDPIVLQEMAHLADHIVNLALDTFIFENTYLLLKPNVKVLLPVYLTNIEQMGSINYYYNFKLMDSVNDELVLTKLVRVFADVLPCPIQIEPPLMLVMEPQISFGFWKDHFTVYNRDIVHKVIIKLKLADDMKQLLTITPMETTIPNLSSVEFVVKFCSVDYVLLPANMPKVHFVIQIQVVFGPNYYSHMHPICYEIIAPCVTEFRETIVKQVTKKYGWDKNMSDVLKKLDTILT